MATGNDFFNKKAARIVVGKKTAVIHKRAGGKLTLKPKQLKAVLTFTVRLEGHICSSSYRL